MTIMQRKIYSFEDLEMGMEASFQKAVSDTDIVAFAGVSGDKNPVHLDADYAARTMFKERIAHGMLTASYISAVFGMEMPGPGAIYVSQTLNFRARPCGSGTSSPPRSRWSSCCRKNAAPGSSASASSPAKPCSRARPS